VVAFFTRFESIIVGTKNTLAALGEWGRKIAFSVSMILLVTILGAALSVVTLYLEQALLQYLDATRTGSGAEALTLAVLTLLLVATSFLVSPPVNINRFSTHAAYRNRLVRTFLGASNSRRRCNLFTGFSRRDNFALAALAYHPFRRGRKRVREKSW